MTVSLSAADGGGGGTVNNGGGGGGGGTGGGRRVLATKTDSLTNVNNNNNNNNNEPNPSPSITGKASVLTVRRVLFGPPAAPAETRAWLDRQLCMATAADSRSWNFDFVNERPLRDSPADRYAWERVCPPQPQRRDDETADSDRRTAAAAAAKQRQTQVTDYMSNIKKRPMNKMIGNDVDLLVPSTGKRSRRSLAI